MFCFFARSDWLGLDGLVTQKNPDENVNHLPSANAETVPDGIVAVTTDCDALRRLLLLVLLLGMHLYLSKMYVYAPIKRTCSRSIAVSNPRRSLPDIPSEGILPSGGDTVTYERNGDNTSDLYATVEPYQNTRMYAYVLACNLAM